MVSVLFNESKLLKSEYDAWRHQTNDGFSTLQRVEIAEIDTWRVRAKAPKEVSVLFNESKLLKSCSTRTSISGASVSVLFNESKLLKSSSPTFAPSFRQCFSTLQRVEIAEIYNSVCVRNYGSSFSTLQRVEIAEMPGSDRYRDAHYNVSVLFNESKLLKFAGCAGSHRCAFWFQYSSTSRNC